MQFYVLMVVLAPWVLKGSNLKVLLAFVLVAWSWRFGCTVFFPVHGDQGATQLFMISTQLPGTLDEFVAGLLLAKLLRTERGARWLAKPPIWSVVLAIAAVWGVLTLFWRYTYWDLPLMVVFYRTLLAGAFMLVLFAACTLTAPWFVKLTAPLRYLGTISYGIYLWHLPVLLTLHDLPWLTPQRALPLILALSVCLAAVSWHFFEKPLMVRFAKRS
jgi:peptidoglycan/LPS O-acetylase OafA/YrhL